MDDEIIDVVVPVYNNFADARRLFDHIEQASNISRSRILVVDDASFETLEFPIPRIGGSVVDVRLIRHETNRGFAASVNAAMRESRGDVILLNTDTLVFDGWIDRLKTASSSCDRVATVTPLSNAATILSYPTFPYEFKATLETEWRSIDRMCARIGGRPVTIPTGIGFCMLIRRACLEAIGPFDEAVFKNGYGEECDFCRRAASAGWLNLAAPNVFVWHRGEGSFQASAPDLRARAQAILRTRHPEYHRLIARFIRDDPLRNIRRQLDLARLLRDTRQRSLHLQTTPARDVPCDPADIYLEAHRSGVMHVWRPASTFVSPLPNLRTVSIGSSASALRAFLEDMRLHEIVVYPGSRSLFAWRMRSAARRLGIRERSAKESDTDSARGIQI